ncbi:hypothetical protein GOBAR_DD01577 [Gossypium barbadense]|nr:hypothetical protein GOBAR_DD01577 [Gossypium barbadense]
MNTHNTHKIYSSFGTAEDDGEFTDEWEEEDETVEPKVGDGGDGGGVVLQGVPWGESALSIAHDALKLFSDDIKLYAFKTTPRGYIYVRLDKLSDEQTASLVVNDLKNIYLCENEIHSFTFTNFGRGWVAQGLNSYGANTNAPFIRYGCPSMEELQSYSQEYKKRLDEAGQRREIPDDLALQVSSPGAERILKVPDDLDRFKDMAMRVCYIEDAGSNYTEKSGVFLLDLVEEENCVWKLAEVKENRDPNSKGRPFSRKQKDWRLKLPFDKHKMIMLYLEY